MGVDETIVKVRAKPSLWGFVAAAASGRLLGIDMPVERDGAGFADWLKWYAGRLGVKAVATDGLSTYKPVVDELGLDRHVCVTHVRKNATRRLRKVSCGRRSEYGASPGWTCASCWQRSDRTMRAKPRTRVSSANPKPAHYT